LALLAARGITAGAIFRRVLKGGHVGAALGAASVREIVRQRCLLAGIEGPYSAHSLRSGFVTEAGKQAMSIAETMAMTGHRSVASVVGYFRSEASLDAPIARLLRPGNSGAGPQSNEVTNGMDKAPPDQGLTSERN
jgi:hypothetical protein